MPLVPLRTMTFGEIEEYVESLERQVKSAEKKLDNRRKLLPSEVRRIRAMYDNGAWTQAEIAEAFCINNATVSRICSRQYYKEIA